MDNILYTTYTNERCADYRIITQIIERDGKRYVKKLPATPQAKPHIDKLIVNYDRLKAKYEGTGINIAHCEADGEGVIFDYIKGMPLSDKLEQLVVDNDMSAVLALFKRLKEVIDCAKDKTEFKQCDEFQDVFGTVELQEGLTAHSFSNIDLMLGNIIEDEQGNLTVIDYEWCYDFAVPDEFILYRMVINHGFKHNELIVKDLCSYLGISDGNKRAWHTMERNLMERISSGALLLGELYERCGKDSYSAEDMQRFVVSSSDNCVYQIFYNYGEGYSEQNSILRTVSLADKINVRIPVSENVKSVRFDPAVCSGIAFDLSVKAFNEGVYEPEFTSNGYNVKSTILYSTDDPQLEISSIEEGTEYIDISYNYRDMAAGVIENLAVAIHDMNSFKKKSEALRNEKDAILVEKDAILVEKDAIEAKLEAEKTALEADISALEEDNKRLQAKALADIAELNEQIADMTSRNNELSEDNTKVKDELDVMRYDRDIHAIKLAKAEELNKEYEHNIAQYRLEAAINAQNYEAIKNSRIWRYTAPVRHFTTALRSNRAVYLLCRTLLSLRRYGLVKTCSVIKDRLLHRESYTVSTEQPVGENIAIDAIQPLMSINKTIAVHLHLYYVDLLDEFFKYFNNIPFSFDLYVSCKGGSDIGAITKKFKKLRCVKKVDVRETINRGRDIAPLYVQFGREIENYDYFLHVHSKKSLFTGKEQYGWRQHSLDCLLKDEATVRMIFSLFESDNKVGLFYPETFGGMHLIAQDWLANVANGKRLLNELGIEFDDGLFNYPVGSFFWAKMDAVKPLFDRKFKYEDFPEEAGQTDGTIAHALERVISFVVRSRGYQEAIYEVKAPYVCLGKSYKVYQDYFKLEYEAVQYHLSQYDLVSFDIFDTLITRCVYNPDDVFEIMRLKAEKELGLECDYLKARKEAEALAWNERKEFTNINDIYAKLPKVLNISAETADRLKAMEIELELELCIPREDMLRCFNHIKACGKKIVLVSDMYLTSDIVSRMLEKCGYSGYDDIWISCEVGKRKDNDTIWTPFFDVYGGLNTVHVGDNPRSDIQLVGDRVKNTFFVINPRTAFKMSKYYNTLKKYINGSVYDRILLGMFINGGVYNSPFCQGEDGEPVLNNERSFGYSAYGSLFSAFSLWLNDAAKDNSKLLFLAREGYIFEQIYKSVFKHCEDEIKPSMYTLASRRAVSVASIKDEQDVKSIVEQYYRGSLSNLLSSRLGTTLFEGMQDRTIAMPEDTESVMNELRVHVPEVLEIAAKERESYLNYIASTETDDKAVIVDVGYSGTIQYYWAKLLDKKTEGLYLCTWVDKKPDKLGCRCEAMYPVRHNGEEPHHPIFRNQLFLEAVLKAPFGQLVRFNMADNKPVAEYKSDSVLSEELKNMQSGIIAFADKFGDIIGRLGFKTVFNIDMPAELFDICINGGWLGAGAAYALEVQDDYCSNGNYIFDPVSKKWIVTGDKNN